MTKKEMKSKENLENSNFCIFCGEEIPEGRMLCYACENTDRNGESDTHLFVPASDGTEARTNKSEGKP